MLIKRSGMLPLFLACSCFMPVIGRADDTADSKSKKEAAPIVAEINTLITHYLHPDLWPNVVVVQSRRHVV